MAHREGPEEMRRLEVLVRGSELEMKRRSQEETKRYEAMGHREGPEEMRRPKVRMLEEEE